MKNNSGYIYQEALVAIMITVLSASITFACFKAYQNNENILALKQRCLNEKIRWELSKRKECVLCNQDQDSP